MKGQNSRAVDGESSDEPRSCGKQQAESIYELLSGIVWRWHLPSLAFSSRHGRAEVVWCRRAVRQKESGHGTVPRVCVLWACLQKSLAEKISPVNHEIWWMEVGRWGMKEPLGELDRGIPATSFCSACGCCREQAVPRHVNKGKQELCWRSHCISEGSYISSVPTTWQVVAETQDFSNAVQGSQGFQGDCQHCPVLFALQLSKKWCGGN